MKANLSALSGRPSEAFEDGLKLVRFGHRVEHAQSFLIEFLVGSAIKGIGLDIILKLLVDTQAGDPEILALQRELGKYEAGPQAMRDVVKMEYSFARTVGPNELFYFVELEGERDSVWWQIPCRILYQENRTCQLLADGSRVLLANERDILAPGKKELPEVDIDLLNLGGWLVSDVLTPSPVTERYLSNFQLRAARCAIALHCYHRLHGGLPKTLAELVPQFLEEVPRDPYDGEPLRYDEENGIVYAVGEDLVDDGGSEEESDDDAFADYAEPTLWIPHWDGE